MDLQGFGAQLASGTWITVQLALASMACAVVLGLLGASAKTAGPAPLRWLGTAYTGMVRGLPELLVILLVYFGAAMVVNQAASALGYTDYIELSPFVAGVIALAFNYGAYMTEVFRGALATIPRGHTEAGMALGMGRLRIFRRIVLPQVWRVALPASGNIFLALLKDTALVSVIGLEDLMRETAIAVGYSKQPFTFYLAAAFIYLGLTAVATLGIHWLERRTTHGMRTLSG
ncbi:ABC transporter permease [Spiribacter insolitus]|uniref:ABC transporter permease n=1 Tax=Spiribacter insolitus TaxID=3122417 RepID=A0ABV3T4N5_9GAMM